MREFAPEAIEIDWMQTAQGRRLLAAELRELRSTLDSVFGDYFLQIGAWGGDAFLRLARTRRAGVLAEQPAPGVAIVTRAEQLAVATDSVDAVLLAHALETHPDPHGLLREVHRILRPEGQLIVLCFNPRGLWGLRRLAARGRFPPGARHLIAEHRLTDWLRLLNYRVHEAEFCHYQLPLSLNGRRPAEKAGKQPLPNRRQKMREGGERLLRAALKRNVFAACYVLVAQKEIYPLTPVRPAWRTRPRLVGGLVNPTTRNAA